MYSYTDFEIIKDMVISSLPQAERIYLFGSYAKGTAREQSDVDIAILLGADLPWRSRNEVLNSMYRDTALTGYNVDFVFKRSDRFFAESDMPTLSRVILREGKLLWKNN